MKFWLLIALLTIDSLGFAYDLPSEPHRRQSSDTQFLLRFSKGIADLSADAAKGIVFISISKRGRGTGFEMNPFDYWFNPRVEKGASDSSERRQQGVGSGFFVDLKRGYIISNNHVIADADEISLKLANGGVYAGKILGRDPTTDVAVIQIKDKAFNRRGLDELRLASTDQTRTGELVLALGAPFGLEASVSFGVISATSRGNLDIIRLGNFMQTDAAINPGNSGGPLLNMAGEVIGVNTAIYSRTGASAGIGFAIPARLVRQVATELINSGKISRAYLGVRLDQDLSEDIVIGLNLPKDTQGALVSEVEPGTAAAKAGLEAGDVIISLDGQKVKDRSELTYRIGLLRPGTKAKLELYRRGKLQAIQINLDSAPETKAKSLQKSPRAEANAPAGLKLQPINPKTKEFAELKKRYGITVNKGLLVLEVLPNSEAEVNGIQEGDVLLEANQKELLSVKDFEGVYRQGQQVLLKLQRGSRNLFATLRR